MVAASTVLFVGLIAGLAVLHEYGPAYICEAAGQRLIRYARAKRRRDMERAARQSMATVQLLEEGE